jgi:hypothetical protein
MSVETLQHEGLKSSMLNTWFVLGQDAERERNNAGYDFAFGIATSCQS